MYFYLDIPPEISGTALAKALTEQFAHLEDDKLVTDIEWDEGSQSQGTLLIKTGHEAFNPVKIRFMILSTRIRFTFDGTALVGIIQSVVVKWVGQALMPRAKVIATSTITGEVNEESYKTLSEAICAVKENMPLRDNCFLPVSYELYELRGETWKKIVVRFYDDSGIEGKHGKRLNEPVILA